MSCKSMAEIGIARQRHRRLLGMVASAARRHLRRPACRSVRNRSAGPHLCSAIFAGLRSTRNSRNSQPLKQRACESRILPATRSMTVRHRKRPNTPPNVAGYCNSSSAGSLIFAGPGALASSGRDTTLTRIFSGLRESEQRLDFCSSIDAQSPSARARAMEAG